MHVEGFGGGSGGGKVGRKNVTDEVIDSALRYRVQGPMIDSLMREIGIEGSSLGRMSDVIRDAKDMASIARDTAKLPEGSGKAGKSAGRGGKSGKPDDHRESDD